MRNRQIPRSEWFRFFDGFSRRHEGRPVTVRILDPGFGSQVEARELPLAGIVSPAGAEGPISIHAGANPEKHIDHEIRSPRQVWLELSDEGEERAFEIMSRGGTRTIVELLGSARQGSAGELHP